MWLLSIGATAETVICFKTRFKADFAELQSTLAVESYKFSTLLGGQKIRNGRYRGCNTVGHDSTWSQESSAAWSKSALENNLDLLEKTRIL